MTRSRGILPLMRDPMAFWRKAVEDEHGCWIWAGCINSDGYGSICRKGQRKKAHRHAWELARGPIPDGLWVLHRCDVPACVNPDHLYLGTVVENLRDAIERGRLVPAHGLKHGMSKLNDVAVRVIRWCSEHGYSRAELARAYRISNTVVSAIARGKAWKHVR